MEIGSSSRIWISDSRDVDLAVAAERARVAAERVASDRGDAAGGNLLSRLRRRLPLRLHPVTR